MTTTHHELVGEFARTFGHPAFAAPTHPDRRLRKLRLNLLVEEYRELVAAVKAEDMLEVADAIADIAYIAHGTLHAYGLPFNPKAAGRGLGLPTAIHWYTKVEKAAGQTVGDLALAQVQDELSNLLNSIIVEVKAVAASIGVPYDAVFREVHASNMSKLGADGKPIYRQDGKVVKGPNYFAPRLFPILAAAGLPVTVTA